jgi:hypothetical protein
MRGRIADIDAHRRVPAIGDAAEPRVERGAQFRDQVRQRIAKYLYSPRQNRGAPSDAAAEMRVVRIERCDRIAFVRREQSLEDGAALRVEVGGGYRPVDGIDAGGDVAG